MKGISSDSPSSSVLEVCELVPELTSKPSPGRPSRSRSPVKKHGQSLLNHSTNIKKHRSSSSASNSSSSSSDRRARSPRKKPLQRRHMRSPSNSRSNTPSPARDWKYRSRCRSMLILSRGSGCSNGERIIYLPFNMECFELASCQG